MSLVQSILIGLIAGYSVHAQANTSGCDPATGCVPTENISSPALFPTTVQDKPAQNPEKSNVGSPAVTQTKPEASIINSPVISEPKSQVSKIGSPVINEPKPQVSNIGSLNSIQTGGVELAPAISLGEAQQRLSVLGKGPDFEFKQNHDVSIASDEDGVQRTNRDRVGAQETKKDGLYSIHQTRNIDEEEKTKNSHIVKKESFNNQIQIGKQAGSEGSHQVDDEEEGSSNGNTYSANRFQGANHQVGFRFHHKQQEQSERNYINYRPQQQQNEPKVYHVRQQRGSNYHHQIQSNTQQKSRFIGYHVQSDENEEEEDEDSNNQKYLIHYGSTPTNIRFYVPGSQQGQTSPYEPTTLKLIAPEFDLMESHQKELLDLYGELAKRCVYLRDSNLSVRPILEFVNNNKLKPEMSYYIINKMNDAFKQNKIQVQWTEMDLISRQVEYIKYKKIDGMVQGFFVNFKQYTPKFVELYNPKFRELFKYQGKAPIDLTAIRNFYLLVAPSSKPEEVENTIKRVFVYIAHQHGIKHQLAINFDPIDKPVYVQNPIIYVSVPVQDDLLDLNENQYQNQLELAIRKILSQQESTEAKKNTVYGIYQQTDSAFSNELNTLQNFFKELESSQNDYQRFIKFTNDCRNNGRSNLLAKIIPQAAGEGDLDIGTFHRVIKEIPQIKAKEVGKLEESFKKFASVFEQTTKRNGFEQVSQKVQNELSASTAHGSFSSKFESSMNRSIQFS